MKKIIVSAILATASAMSFALDLGEVKQSIPLKDGATVHLFADGKMAMEDKYGRAVFMADGHMMETSQGEKFIMRGNEVARLDSLLRKDY
mgnify:CR=1 FL=1|jgi:hypothetical protein